MNYSLNEILILTGVLLLLADFWIGSDLPTHIAWVVFSTLMAINITDLLLYQLVIGSVSWFVLVAFHYVVWTKLRLTVINRYISPEFYVESSRRFNGQFGEIVTVGTDLWIELNGDRYPIRNPETLKSGERVVIERFNDDGSMTVKILYK